MTLSAEVAGGLGTTYETQIGAYYLAALLTGAPAQGLEPAVVSSVAFQRGAHGFPLDDLVIEGRRGDDTVMALQLQAKTRLEVGGGSRDFREIVQACCEALAAGNFRQGVDRFGVATASIAESSYRAVRRITETARHSADESDFLHTVTAPGQFDRHARRVLDAFREAISHDGQIVAPGALWTLLRHFVLMRIETVGEGALHRAGAISGLARRLPIDRRPEANSAFDALEALARQMNARSGKVDAATLLERLQGRFAFTTEHAAHSLATCIVDARDAARRQTSAFKISRGLPDTPLAAPAYVDLSGQDGPVPLDADALLTRLSEGKVVSLRAGPGTGKTTALTDLAERALERTDTLVPLIVVLPELDGSSIIDDLLARPHLRMLGRNCLEGLASDGRLVLLCDAWNEVAESRRDDVARALKRLRGDFPRLGLLITGRAGAKVGVESEQQNVGLATLTRDRQLTLLEAFVGVDAEALLAVAEAIPALRELIALPLYLAALGRIGSGTSLPTTRGQLIAGLVRTHDDSAESRPDFVATFRGLHRPVLEGLAVRLVETGGAHLPETAARAEVTVVSKSLVAADQATSPLDTFAALSRLVDHHSVVRLVPPGGAVYAFAHEQIQEWLASFTVERLALAAAGDTHAHECLVTTRLNRPNWAEPVLFAVERMGRGDAAQVQAAARVILLALGIEAIFAAQLIARAGSAVWGRVAPTVTRFLMDWSEEPGVSLTDRASFLCAAGRPELSDLLWPLLETEDRIPVFEVDAAGLHALIRKDWATRHMGLKTETRRVIIYDLIASGLPDAVQFAIDHAVNDPASDVLLSALNLLEYDRAHELDGIVNRIRADVWPAIARRIRLRELEPGPFRDRLCEEKARAADGKVPAGEAASLLLELAEHGQSVDLRRLVELSLVRTEQHDRFNDSRFEAVATLAPDAVSQALVARLLVGEALPSGYEDRILPEHKPPAETVMAIAFAPTGSRVNTHAAALLLDVGQVQDLLRRLAAISAAEWNQREHEDYERIRNVLAEVAFPTLLQAVEGSPQYTVVQVEVLAESLTRWRAPGDWDGSWHPSPDQSAQLSRLVESWVRLVPIVDYQRAGVLADLAGVIGKFRLKERLEALVSLVRRDAELWADGLARNVETLARGGGVALTDRSQLFRCAFDALAGSDVADALLSLLDLEPFGGVAAVGLQRFAKGTLESGRAGMGGVPYDRLAARRLALWSASRGPADPIAGAVLDRIPHLLVGDQAARARAAQFAIAATQMNFGCRIGDLEAVLLHPEIGRRARLGLLDGLLLRGAILPADFVYAGACEAIAELGTRRWRSPQDNWEVWNWLKLSPFSDRPDDLPAIVAQLAAADRPQHKLDDLVFALGHSADAERAIAAIRGLIALEPDLAYNRSVPAAFANLRTNEAAEALMEALVAAAQTPSRFIDGAGTALSAIAAQQPGAFDALLKRTDWQAFPAVRGAVGRALARRMSEGQALLLLDLIEGDGDPLRHALAEAAREIGVDQIPLAGSPNTYELVPRRVDALRHRLLAQASQAGQDATFASFLLNRVERSRRRHGRPPGEGRHPALESQRPWPKAAGTAWADIASLDAGG